MLDSNPPIVIVFGDRMILLGISNSWLGSLVSSFGYCHWACEAQIDMGWNLELPAVAKSTIIEPFQAEMVAELSATFLLPLPWVLSPSSNKQ